MPRARLIALLGLLLGVAALATGALATGLRASGASGRSPVEVVGTRLAVRGPRIGGWIDVRNTTSQTVAGPLVYVSLQTRGRLSWIDRMVHLRRLLPGRRQRVSVSLALPARAPAGRWPLTACARVGWSLSCRTAIRVRLRQAVPPPGGRRPPALGTVPRDPVDYAANSPFEIDNSPLDDYWVDVPPAYDRSGRTPMKLLVWLHGCYGSGQDDAYNWANPDPNRDYLSLSLDGAAGVPNPGCWDTGPGCPDCSKVLAAVANIEMHFNVDRRRIYLGGFSSGGELAYRIIFAHPRAFAGVLIIHSAPFESPAGSERRDLARSTRRFPVVQEANSGDEGYPIPDVERELGDMQGAGFPVEIVERVDGDTPANLHHHYVAGSSQTPGSTRYEFAHLALPHIDDGWWAPGCADAGDAAC